MKKFVLRFTRFNKIYWEEIEKKSSGCITARCLGKTEIRFVRLKSIIEHYSLSCKQFVDRYKKIDNWRNNHRRKNIV